MDYSTARNEPRMDADQDETLGEFRSTDEPRQHYRTHPIQLDPAHRGPLTDLTADELRAVFSEMLDYTGACSVFDWPLPPTGLPGFVNAGRCRNDPEADLIEIGLRYLYHAVNHEPRGMHLRWNDAGAFIRRIENKAEERVWAQTAARSIAADEARIAAMRQFVYFIGAASGPIKIGIAINTQNRLRGLQTSHHEKLGILAELEGNLEMEKAYHARFGDSRLSGEWFERTPEILAEIDRLNSNPTLQP